jgi:pyruvate kinase
MVVSPSRTKIVATIGPASTNPATIRQLIEAGMDVARLNFSHGSHQDHAAAIQLIRKFGEQLDAPVTILQDLQGPKIRAGNLAAELRLATGSTVDLVPEQIYRGEPDAIPIDYPDLARDVSAGAQILLADGIIELQVEATSGASARCRVMEGGSLKSRQGVVVPNVRLNIPSLTEKDKHDLAFGLAHGVDWIALSFVRSADDVRVLKNLLSERGATTPVLAKIEKPEAVADLDAILEVVDGLMVARGDLGVEMRPEKVPMAQKRIIRACNARGVPVITATQMLESMIEEPRPTRAEASDVANAVLDGTDCIMLSGESAVGKFPVQAVRMMHRIACEVEPFAQFPSHPPASTDATAALSNGIAAIDRSIDLRWIVAFTSGGYSARLVSSRRPKAPVFALTPSEQVYHALNLLWGVRPIVVPERAGTLEEVVRITETVLKARSLAAAGDRILIVAGLPMGVSGKTNVVKLHQLGG